jgi:hypothetical protein
MLGFDVLVVTVAFGIIICAHELCHMVGYRIFKISYTVRLRSCAIVVDSPYFAGKFKELSQQKKEQYTLIAMMPYLILIPMIAIYSYYDTVISGFLLASQIVNIPLEFGLY